MHVKLHANATTTPKTRAYIRASQASVASLAGELGVSETTIRRWRSRDSFHDRSHRPRRLATVLTPTEEALICELRRSLALALDDIVEVMRRCLRPLSRDCVYRCLRRHDLARRQAATAAPAASGAFESAPVGFIHVDVKHLPALRREKSYAFVAIDRATRYVYLEVHARRDGATATAFLDRFLAHFPHKVHTVLTDNGAEFTDRFAVDMKDKPDGRSSGRHPFDRLATERHIVHRLTRPFRPQTNGMVERFNRRLAEAIRGAPPAARNAGKNRFDTTAERNAFLAGFVETYNRTRLRCLDYKAPLEAINNLQQHNTKAGTQGRTRHVHGSAASPRSARRRSRDVAYAAGGRG